MIGHGAFPLLIARPADLHGNTPRPRGYSRMTGNAAAIRHKANVSFIFAMQKLQCCIAISALLQCTDDTYLRRGFMITHTRNIP